MDNNPFRSTQQHQPYQTTVATTNYATQPSLINPTSAYNSIGTTASNNSINNNNNVSSQPNLAATAYFDPLQNNPGSLYQQQQSSSYYSPQGYSQMPQPQPLLNSQPLTSAQSLTTGFPTMNNNNNNHYNYPPIAQSSYLTNNGGTSGYNTSSSPSSYYPVGNMPSPQYTQPQQQQQSLPFSPLHQSSLLSQPQLQLQPQQQPQYQYRHAPVDASSLLKGGKVRRVDCPVCHKTIEGDDPAINHHVNEHYS